MFLDLLYEKYIPINHIVQKEIIHSDGHATEFRLIIFFVVFFEVLNPFYPRVVIICKPAQIFPEQINGFIITTPG